MLKQFHTPKGPEKKYRAEEAKVTTIDRVEWGEVPAVHYQIHPERGIYEIVERIRIWHDVLIELPDGTTIQIDQLKVPMEVINCSFDMDDT